MTTTLRVVAGHLPGLTAGDVAWQTLSFGAGVTHLEVEVPALDAAQMTVLAGRVRAAGRRHLQPMPLAQIVAVIDRAIARLLDPADPYRQEADRLLPRITGDDPEMVRLGLTSFLQTFRAPQLHRFVAEDFADPAVLDAFRPRPRGGASRAFGPELLVHSWAGNVPALSLWSLVCGLLVKAPSIGKLASAEPVFAGLFARLLAEVHPPLADCLAIVWWKGGDTEIADALYAQADTVLAYGGSATMAQIRDRLPATTRFLPFGHKLSFGLIGREALDARRAPATARLAALDVARYDQQGCYSPQVFYVERGAKVSPSEFAQRLAGELASLQHRFPRRPLSLAAATGVAAWRDAGELRALAGADSVLLGEADDAWCVVYDEAAQAPLPTALHRSIRVVGVDALDRVVDDLEALRPVLQTVGLAAAPETLYRLADRLGRAGVTRIAALGAMTTPEAGWHHDGRFNLLDLVRMVDIEASAERAADALAPYAE